MQQNALVTPEFLSQEFLFQLFNEAYMDCEIYNNEIKVKNENGVTYYIAIAPDKDSIRLSVYYQLRKDVSFEDKLKASNLVNDTYNIIRTSILDCPGNNDYETLIFNHFIHVAGGVTRKNIIITSRRFMYLVGEALDEYLEEIIP